MAEPLAKEGTANWDSETMNIFWPDPVFTSAIFATKIETLLTEKKYLQNAQKQQSISRLTGGTKAAVSAIEAAYLHYSDAKKI